MADAHHWGMAARLLNQQEDFDMGSRMAQIFSGSMFGALAVYMCFSNSQRLKFVQRAPFEKRLNTCCQLNTIVAAISAFLNFFQLTEVDNWMLPGQRNYMVDVARPIEWIMTCPLMQLSLVIMGGPKIPEYRRTMMPGLAAFVLILGSLTLFFEHQAVVIALYACGCCVHCCAMFFNRQQIIEMSDGQEGLFSGDSEFRKVTIVLMLTWFPFPIWFFLTPEGLGIVEDIVLVQMGWACLNIVSKFTLIFFIQRVKDSYWARVKLTRELKLQAVLPEGSNIEHLVNDQDLEDDELPGQPISDPNSPNGRALSKAHGLPCVTPVGVQEFGETDIILPPPIDLNPLEQTLTFKMDQMEIRLVERIDGGIKAVLSMLDQKCDQPGKDVAALVSNSQESIREKMGCGMMDLGKLIEKANSMLEVKMEIAQSEQTALCQKVATDVQEQLEQYPEELFKRLLDTHDANTTSVQTMQESMDNATKKLEELQDSQGSVLGALSGSLTSLTDGWAQQIIKESQAAAFTLVTKIGVMEDMQNKSQADLEGRITNKLEQMTKEAIAGLRTGVVEQTLQSTEKLHATIEASANVSLLEQSKMQETMAKLVKDLGADVAKHVEAGIGVFGNSLRAQVEALQQAQLSAHLGSEATLSVKWEDLIGRMQQQLQNQVKQMNETVETIVSHSMEKSSKDQIACVQELQKEMEAIAKQQQDRHQDTHAVVTSVLEQSCGAKTRAEDCANHLAILNAELRSPPPTAGAQRERDERYSDSDMDTGPRQGSGRNPDHQPQPKRSSYKQPKPTPQYGLNASQAMNS